MADDFTIKYDSKLSCLETGQEELCDPEPTSETKSTLPKSLESTTELSNEAEESQTLDKMIEALCTLRVAPSGFVNIAIIHDEVSEDAAIRKEDVHFLTMHLTKSIRNVVSAYSTAFPGRIASSMIATSTEEHLNDEDVLFNVHKPSTGTLLILQASNPAHADIVDQDLDVKSLWRLHANNLAAARFKDPNIGDKSKMIVESWQKLSGEDARSLVQQKKQIGDIADNDIDLRTFYIFYHRLLADVNPSRAGRSSINPDAYMRTVLRHWKQQSPNKMKSMRREAMSQIGRIPVCEIPVQGPSNSLFESVLESSHQSDDEPQHDTAEEDIVVMENQPLEVLEAHTERYTTLLETLCTRLSSLSVDTKQHSWILDIERMQQQKTDSHAKIGIVGSTGSGKSSVINAILDEPQLVPTSCWRACTAAVTEISYNDSSEHAYRGEVEFISKADAKVEFEAWSSDLPDTDGKLNEDSSNRSTEAGIALDKIIAMRPDLNRFQISRTNVQEIQNDANVTGYLGTTPKFTANTAEGLSRALAKYVDSTDCSQSNGVQSSQEPALWPIVKCVRLFTKSPLLRDGITLVDLPGVHDSNRARAEVAKNYLKTCSHLFIVAPLTRAVDDKSARDLLGESFKRQMKLDGTYNSSTFIASKADDIGPENDIRLSLGVDAQVKALEREEAELTDQIVSLDQELQENFKLQEKEDNSASEVGKRVHTYRELQKQVEKLGSVPEPRQIGQKRKHVTANSNNMSHRKRRACRNLFGEDPEEPDSESSSPPRMLTAADIDVKLAELKNEHDMAWSMMDDLEANANAMESRIEAMKARRADLDGEKWRVCVMARNNKSRGTLRMDFAAGLREYDQQLGAESPDFDPDENIRNYDAVAKQLPVFCVSSRGYQRLMKLSESGKSVDQFSTAEQTEIPALKRHAIELSQSSRKRHLARYVTRAGLLTTTMRMWATETGMRSDLSEESIAEQQSRLSDGLANLKENLELAISSCKNSSTEQIKSNILTKLPKAQRKASLEALTTSIGWGLPVREKGLPFQTYRATCRRDGVYNSPRLGLLDFNDQLTKPMLNSIVLGWDIVFRVRLPLAMESAANSSSIALRNFHALFKQIVEDLGINKIFLKDLCSQLPRYTASLEDAYHSLQYDILIQQKALSRSLTPSLQDKMKVAYSKAAKVQGKGAFVDMKRIVEQGVEKANNAMFISMRKQVKKGLNSMIETGEEELKKCILSTFDQLSQDYMSMFSNREEALSEEQVLLKSDIIEIMERFQQRQESNMENMVIVKDEPSTPVEVMM